MSYTQENENGEEKSKHNSLISLIRLLNNNNINEIVGHFRFKRQVTLWLSPELVQLFRYTLIQENPINPKSVSQAIHEYMLNHIKNFIQSRNQTKITQFFYAPNSTIMVQNKVEVSAPKCFFCQNIAVTTAVFTPTNRQYPVCQKHAEELKNHPKWRLINAVYKKVK